VPIRGRRRISWSWFIILNAPCGEDMLIAAPATNIITPTTVVIIEINGITVASNSELESLFLFHTVPSEFTS
jgi:hypothetical protein